MSPFAAFLDSPPHWNLFPGFTLLALCNLTNSCCPTAERVKLSCSSWSWERDKRCMCASLLVLVLPLKLGWPKHAADIGPALVSCQLLECPKIRERRRDKKPQYVIINCLLLLHIPKDQFQKSYTFFLEDIYIFLFELKHPSDITYDIPWSTNALQHSRDTDTVEICDGVSDKLTKWPTHWGRC